MAKSEATPTQKLFHTIITNHRSKMDTLRKRWARYASAYRGEYYDRGEEDGASTASNYANATGTEQITVENNYLFAFSDTMVANICPPNPAVTVVASKGENKAAAKFRERLVNDLFYRERAGQKLWQITTKASVWPRCFIKCAWNIDRKRPIYRVINPQFVFYDTTAEEWEDLRYICEAVVITRGEFEQRVRKKGKKDALYRTDAIEDVTFGGYPKWLMDEDMDTESDDAAIVRKGYEWVTIYEFYDLIGGKFYHFAEDCPYPLLEEDLPYAKLKNPFCMLTFNDNLRDLGGLSDAELVFPAIERLNELDSLEMWHIKASIPVAIVHEGLVDDPGELQDALEEVSGPGQIVSIAARPGIGIKDVLGQTPTPQLPVEWGRARENLEKLIQFTLGMPSYSRGELGQSDVATELALSDTATRTRNARRQKAVYLIIEWMATAAISLYSEFMSPDDAIPLTLLEGEDAAVVTRDLLNLRDDEHPMDYAYQARPYNAAEGNDVVQLKSLEAFLPVLLQNPNVDPAKLTQKLLDLLHMTELFTQAAPQQPPMPGMEAEGAPGGDVLGGLQPGMPGEMMGAVQGGEVLAGTGAQAVPGGLEGGMQGNTPDLAALGGRPPMV